MRDHGALRGPGRSRREADQRRVRPGDPRVDLSPGQAPDRFRFGVALERQGRIRARRPGALERAALRLSRRHDPRPAQVDLPAELERAEPPVERHDDGTEPQGGEEAGRPLHRVLADEGHALPRDDAGLPESACEILDDRRELAVRELLSALRERRRLRLHARPTSQRLGQRAQLGPGYRGGGGGHSTSRARSAPVASSSISSSPSAAPARRTTPYSDSARSRLTQPSSTSSRTSAGSRSAGWP